jgi:hypothetical protein
MKTDAFITQFSHNAEVIKRLVSDTGEEQARWKPAPDEWSILEVVNHLYDEEREDFRQRLDLLLHRPGQGWPGIDPEGWVVERKYNQRDLATSLDNFLAERRASLDWLKSLNAPNWEQVYHHPVAGDMSARNLLASWLAHDWLHLRQLVQLQWQWLNQSYNIRYAGEW